MFQSTLYQNSEHLQISHSWFETSVYSKSVLLNSESVSLTLKSKSFRKSDKPHLQLYCHYSTRITYSKLFPEQFKPNWDGITVALSPVQSQ